VKKKEDRKFATRESRNIQYGPMSSLSSALSSSVIRRSIVKAISSSTTTGRCYFANTTALWNVPTIKLHTEWIAPEVSKGDDSNRMDDKEDENHTILFMHGLLGNGRNLKTFARKLVKQQSSNHGSCRGGILMDLRGHGTSYQSQRKEGKDNTNISNYDKASTFRDCAQDIHHTLEEFHDDERVGVLVGHSFGGR
jgi:pimeloyl-ACP methyl ester carboxylesterase